jgi:hypothetical protein
MVNEIAVPRQEIPLFVYVGITEIIPEIGVVAVFEAVKFKSPIPDAASPMDGFELVQL